jgi:Holliday junction DNA helicase RuvA
MIDYLTGKLVAVYPEAVVIEVGGFGLRVQVPPSLAATLPQPGETIRLHTYLAVRNDAMELFGFADELDRTVFLHLLGVSGIGPRTALTVVGWLGTRRLLTAILQEDTSLLVTVPGIGVKSARRIVVELRDRLEKQQLMVAGDGSTSGTAAQREALAALISLGYTARDAGEALNRVPDQNAGPADLVKSALRILSAG